MARSMASNEASMDRLLVTDLGPDITKEMIEAFFETRGMKIASVSVPENGQAIVELITSGKDIRSFLVKKHKIRQRVFNIELMENDQISDDRSSTIEVSYPEDLSTDILKLYLQGPGPGGNNYKAIKWIEVIEPGKCHIKFESDGDAIAVSAEPKQKFIGKTLNVQRCLPVKAKHDLDKLLVKRVPEGVSEDYLATFLDGYLDLEHETDYTVKLKNSCAVVIFTKQYSAEELNSFCEKIPQKKLKGCVVSADRCNSTDVANILSSDKPASTSSGTYLCSSEEDGYETDKLLIKDIPEAASSEEVLTVFIDGRLDLEHEIDYNLIMLKDTCAVIVFKKKISVKELNAFSQKLSKGKIQGKTISAHKCQINSPETIEICSILAAPPKQEYETDQLLITGIPEGVSEMYLATFLDGYLDLDHESDHYKFKMKRTCALVKFSQDYSVDELSAFCENISSHKLKEETVTVEKCCVNCSILVTKIGKKDFKSQGALQMYFQGKNSGAGKGTVESIVMLGADRVKVTFKEPSVVVAVLSKDHTNKLGPNVSVVACSPLDGLDGSFEEEEADPSPPSIDNTPTKTMKPVTVHIDRLLAKFLQQNSELLDSLGREIRMFAVLLNDSDRIIELQPTESTPTDYSETSSERFQSLLSTKVSKADINIPPEAVKNLYPMLVKQCSSENMLLVFKDDIVSVAGLCESVLGLQKMAEQYCRYTIMTTGQQILTGEEYRYFARCKLKQVANKYKGLKIEFTENEDSSVMSFSGSVHDVELFHQTLDLLAYAKTPVDLSRLAIAFLHKGKGFNILKTIIGHPSMLPYFSADRLTLSLLCSHDDAQHAVMIAMKIRKEIVEKELKVSPYFLTNVAESAKFNDFLQKTSRTYAFLCQVDRLKIKLVCQDKIIVKLSQVFEKFVAEECAITEKIAFKRGVWRLFNSILEAKWNALKEEMTNNEVSIVSSSKPTALKPFVKVKGEHGKVEKIKAKILELQKLIKEERITKCRPGMVRYFLKDTQGQITLSVIEAQAKICIEVEVESDGHEAELEASTMIGTLGHSDSDKTSTPQATKTYIPLDSAEVTLCIYGESEAAVKRAVKQLTSLIDTTFIFEEVDDEHIIELPSNVISDLEEFAKKHDVGIDIDTDADLHCIKLVGCQIDVLEVKDKVRDVLAKMNQWKTKEEAAATVCKHVKWVRQYSDGPEDYDELTNFAIEQAFQQKKDIYNHDGGEEKFKVDFSKMEDIDLDRGEVVKVQRLDFSQVEKPAGWVPMPKDSNGHEAIVHLVPLKQTSAEYKNALGQFNKTMQSHYQKIVSIQRIQNPVQYGQYVARKKEMDKRNPRRCQNERWLFHGTKSHVVENINIQGFNRSFKASTTVYGQGVYFARDASYSHGYAPADTNQHHHMYLTRVLTGEFTVGQQTMLVPPPKPNQQNRNVLYDSTVNNTGTPTIFVVYNDAQAYAAHLITYQ